MVKDWVGGQGFPEETSCEKGTGGSRHQVEASGWELGGSSANEG